MELTIKELKSELRKVAARHREIVEQLCKLYEEKLDLESLNEKYKKEIKALYLKRAGATINTDQVTASEILYFGSAFFQIEIENLISHSRKETLVKARFMIIHQIRSRTEMSMKDIGKFMNNRDHTSILHSIKTVNDLYKVDAKYRREFDTFIEFLDNQNKVI